MLRRRPPAVLVLAAWTLLVWGQRIVNIVAKDGGDGLDLARAIVFVAVGLAVGVVALAPVADAVARRVVVGGAGLTILLWAVQIVAIPLRDHPAGFVVVHVALGVVSIALATWAVRSVVFVPGAARSYAARRYGTAGHRH